MLYNNDMEKSAVIYMKNSKEDEDYSLITNGTVSFEAGGIYMKYGEDNDETCIGISNDTVTITKLGEMSYTLVLETDKDVSFFISTEQGDISVDAKPTLVSTDITEDVIEVEMKYDMIFNVNYKTENSIYLKCVITKLLI